MPLLTVGEQDHYQWGFRPRVDYVASTPDSLAPVSTVAQQHRESCRGTTVSKHAIHGIYSKEDILMTETEVYHLAGFKRSPS